MDKWQRTELLVTDFPTNQHIFFWLVCVMYIVIVSGVWYIVIKLFVTWKGTEVNYLLQMIDWEVHLESLNQEVQNLWVFVEYLSLIHCDLLIILPLTFPHALFTVHEGIALYYSLTIISLLYLGGDEINHLYQISSALRPYLLGCHPLHDWAEGEQSRHLLSSSGEMTVMPVIKLYVPVTVHRE